MPKSKPPHTPSDREMGVTLGAIGVLLLLLIIIFTPKMNDPARPHPLTAQH